METLTRGQVFAGFVIDRLLGRGGMGAVYAAHHPRLPRLIALKLLSSQLSDDNYFRARFEREAELAGRLDHPNLVSVLDRGSEGGQLWIAMQLVEGIDGSAALARGEMPDMRAVHLVRETAKALDYAHGFGLLHRDVKPANILVAEPFGPEERVLLGDFGIAKARDESTQLTQAGDMVATLVYASPEQLEGKELDTRSDVYSLGCTFFHLLTGRPPYASDSPMAVMHGHLFAPVPRLSAVRPDLPPALDHVIARVLAKDPNQRYWRCGDFANDITAAFAGAATAPVPQTPVPASRRRPWLLPAALGVAAVAAVGIGAVVVVVNGDSSNTATGTTSTTRATTTTTSAGTTGSPADGYARAQPAIELFPQLLPATETGKGFHDATCNIFHGESPDAQSNFVYTVTCIDRDNLEFKVIAYENPAEASKAKDSLPRSASADRVSRYGNSVEISKYVGENQVPFIVVGFYDAPQSSYLVEAAWPAHTSDEIVTAWFDVAPI